MADHLHQLGLTPISRPVRDRKKARVVPPRRVRHRSPNNHAGELKNAADEAFRAFQETEMPGAASAKQIVRLATSRRINEKLLARNGLTVLDSSSPTETVAVSADPKMETFRSRVEEYGESPDTPERPEDLDPGEPDPGPRATHEEVFDAIDGFERRTQLEKQSSRLRAEMSETREDDNLELLVELYSPEDTELRARWTREVLSLVGEFEPDLFDQPAVGVTILRLSGTVGLVEELSMLDQTAWIDSPEQARLTAPRLAELQDLEQLDPQIEPPDDLDPAVGIIDSGLRVNHPMIEPAALGADAVHPAFGGQGEDGFGHGTLVAGLALYGDVLESINDLHFEAPFPLASVRIFDNDGRVPAGVNAAKLIDQAIDHLVEEYDCRVICLSLGDHNQPFLAGMKASAMAALVDDAARAHDIVVVVPTGNIEHHMLPAPAPLLKRYPAYLSEPGNELLSPSQAALALTVGAISESAASDIAHPGASVAAPAGAPAPYARRGPGVRSSIKPELVEDGGNWVFDDASGDILDDTGTAVISLSARDDLLFDTAIGSSFAAARVAHIANSVAVRYPQLSSAGIRALVLQGATPTPTPGLTKDQGRAVAGHGRLSLERCLSSTDERVVALAEQSLRPDAFHVYRIPEATDFFRLKGVRHLTLSLAFDPPVRYRRYDYLAYQMEFLVVRGIPEDEVFHLASSANKGKLSELSKKQFKLQPATTVNGQGTNQAATVTLRTRPRAQFQQDWFVVVRSLNKWMKDRSPQPYALALGVEVENSAQLFGQMQAKLDLQGRLRSRR